MLPALLLPIHRKGQSVQYMELGSDSRLNGPLFSLAAQRGHPVVLFFMAASCTSCLLESNALGQIQRKYGNNVRIALIDIGKGDSSTALRAFVQRSAGPGALPQHS